MDGCQKTSWMLNNETITPEFPLESPHKKINLEKLIS